MEAYVLGIGTLKSLKQWEDDLQAVKLPYEYKKGKKCLIRLGVCKIQMYKIFFPEEHLEVVSGMLGISDYITKRFKKIKTGINIFRKLLKLKELKIPDNLTEHMQPDQIDKAVAIIPIGTKTDDFDEKGMEKI